MADRCEYCSALISMRTHDDSCPTMNEEIREKSDRVREENDGLQVALKEALGALDAVWDGEGRAPISRERLAELRKLLDE